MTRLRIQTATLPLSDHERALRFNQARDHVESIRNLDQRIEEQKEKLSELKELREEAVINLMTAVGGERQQTLDEATGEPL